MSLLDNTYGKTDSYAGGGGREAIAAAVKAARVGSPKGVLPPYRRRDRPRSSGRRRVRHASKPIEVSFAKLRGLRAKFPIGDSRIKQWSPYRLDVDTSGKCSNVYEFAFVARPDVQQVTRSGGAVPAPDAGRPTEFLNFRVACNRRDCPECAARKARAFGRKLSFESKEAIEAGGSVALVTLTACDVALTKFDALAMKDARRWLARPGRLPLGVDPSAATVPAELFERMQWKQWVRHVQLWKKRLKWAAGEDGKGIRFAYAFEYGEKRGRPHIHAEVICAPGVIVTESDLRNEWREIPPGARASRKARGGYRELDEGRFIEFAKQGRWDALRNAMFMARVRFAPIGSVDVKWVGSTSADLEKSARYLGKYVAKGGRARGPIDFGKPLASRKFNAMVRSVNRLLRGAPVRKGSLFRDGEGNLSDGTKGDFGAWVRWCQEQVPGHPCWMPRAAGYKPHEVRASAVREMRERISAVSGVAVVMPGDDGLAASFDASPVARGPPGDDDACPF